MYRNTNAKIQQHFPKKTYFVICEDEKSMLYYLKGISKTLNQKVILRATHAQHPDIKNIQKEVKAKEKELKIKGTYGDFQVVACFDKDDNDLSVVQSIVAENNRVSTRGTIYHNPCYEYWLLLHVESTNRPFASAQECSEYCLKKINRTYAKQFKTVDELKGYENIFNLVGKDVLKAIKNADLYSYTNLDETYTNMHVFLKELYSL